MTRQISSRIVGWTGTAVATSMPSARFWDFLAVVVFALAVGLSQSGGSLGAQPQYAPAYYYGTQLESPQVVVFPPTGGQIVLPLVLPGLLRFSSFTQDGRTIFATINTKSTSGHLVRLGPPRLIRVDLSPVHVTTLADLVGLGAVFGLVISPHQDKILFTGAGWKGSPGCDLFEIEASGENFRRLLSDFGCDVGGVSPDGTKMLVRRGDGLSVVDFATGTAVSLGTGLWKGAWSPDGRWIAALHLDPPSEEPRPRLSKTIRIDASDFSKRLDLGGTNDEEVMWSPDSKYLLYCDWGPSICSHSDGLALVTLDVESGKRVVVKGSKCKIKGRNIGWVSLDAVTRSSSLNPRS